MSRRTGGQQTLFRGPELDALSQTWRHLEWGQLSDDERHLVGRCEPLGEAVSRGARLTPDARALVAACSAAGLLGWLRSESQAALERLLSDGSEPGVG